MGYMQTLPFHTGDSSTCGLGYPQDPQGSWHQSPMDAWRGLYVLTTEVPDRNKMSRRVPRANRWLECALR